VSGEYPFGRARASFYLGFDGEPPLPAGTPLLAYGANASPEALARKLPRARVAALAGTLRGFAVVHSAHVSPYGAVPATLVPAPGAEEPVHVLLVAGDRARLDATEPNYRRVRLHGVDLEVERLGRPYAVEAYLSRHGPLAVGGRTVPLGTRSQEELRALLGRPLGGRQIISAADETAPVHEQTALP
jgi:hypothetical protein